MSITNITLVYEYYDMFTNVDGVNVGGWVGFGLFLVLGIITGVLALGKKIKDAEDIYRILLYCGALIVAYLLTALEQFIIVRDDKQHINLLMAVVNALVWMFVVLCTSGHWTYAMNPVMRKYAIIIGVSSQVIMLSGAFVWNAAVYAVWGIGFLAMQASLAH